MSKKDYVEYEGTVTAALPNAMFKVQLDKPVDKELLCHISGKIRKNYITIMPGDRVKVEISIVDMSKGRITYRSRAK